MKKYVYITVENDWIYEFEFADMRATNSNTIRLADTKCSLEDKISLFNAGIATCFSNVGSIYIDLTKAKYVGFELRK